MSEKIEEGIKEVVVEIDGEEKTLKLNGYKPDPVDKRDWVFKAPAFKTTFKAGTSVDLRPYAGRIVDQGNIGSCVGNSSCNCLEMIASIKGGFVELSRLFMYYIIREPYGTPVTDSGAYPRDAFKYANRIGVCDAEVYPYIESKVNDVPPQEAYDNASDNRTLAYYRILSMQDDGNTGMVNDIKFALDNNMPVLFGVWLGSQFFGISGPLDQQVYPPVNTTDNTFQGGHAMNICGYVDDINKPGGGYFIVENSWGTTWGDGGFCALSYDVANADFTDIWTCTDFKAGLLPDVIVPENVKKIATQYKANPIFPDSNLG